MDEDPRKLMKLIKNMYQTFEFDPPSAKDYDQEGADLYRDLHAAFVSKGWEKLSKGMQGLNSG